MDKQLQQRLIGAAVLVSLGVIFIPALLDGAGYKSRHSRSIEIPPEPKFAPLTELKIAKIKTPIEARNEKPAQQFIQKDPAKPSTSSKKSKEAPIQAWALQVGTFSEEANALVLRDKLRADKHPAYVVVNKEKGQQSYKVKIGPIINKQRVEKLKEKIKLSHKLDGYIVPHP